MVPVNFFNGALVRDAIGECERFGLRRWLHQLVSAGPARQTWPSAWRINGRGKSDNGEPEKSSSRSAADDVTTSFAFSFRLFLPLSVFFADLPTQYYGNSDTNAQKFC
jgi:hypothetical protein